MELNMDGGLVIVPAGAGAGKTHRIKTQLADWVKRGLVRPERILAVTFTEAAASELRERIRAGLLAEGLVEGALAHCDRPAPDRRRICRVADQIARDPRLFKG